jgi:predicted double-glycine peptidase
VATLPAGALPVPLVRQATRYSCGAAALLSILYYWQKYDGNESSLYHELETTESYGTEPESIAKVARDKFGLAARYRSDVTLAELAAALARGETVIVAVQAWAEPVPRDWSRDWDDGHYVVLVALDKRRAYFMDPSTAGGYAFLGRDELVQRWHDVEGHGGNEQRRQHMAIFIAGHDHLRGYPVPSVEMH